MTLDRNAIHHAIAKVASPSYVPPIELPANANPFSLGRLAAQNNLAPSRSWPERVVAGWQFEVNRTLKSNESFDNFQVSQFV